MIFAQPVWLWAFLLFPGLLVLLVSGERQRAALIGKLVAARLQPRLAANASPARRRWRFFFALLGLAAAILALARPQWGFAFEPAKRKGRDVLIAIDTSRSMLADDVKPDRLSRAKLAAEDLLDELSGDRVGIVAFAGTAFLQAPLTVDYSAVRNSLKELDTEVIPQGGSNLEGALRAAREAFGKGESDHRALVVFSDGEELDADAQKALAEFGDKLKVFAVGVGTPEGALIPVRNRGRIEFVQDETGNPVRTRLDESRLRGIAEATGGFYLRLQTGRLEMQQIVRNGLGKMTEQDIDARMSQRPIERYQWPLSGAIAALIVALLLGERRRGPARATAAAVLLAATLAGSPARAAGWLPQNPGVRSYAHGENLAAEQKAEAASEAYEQAYQEFSRQLKWQPRSPEAHYNLGTAAYKKGAIDEAMRHFSEGLLSKRPDVQVNSRDYLGNSLFQNGQKKEQKEAKVTDWKAAVQQYDAALQLDPNNQRVARHRDFVLGQIAALEQEPPKSDQPKDQEQKDQKDQEKQEQKDQQDQKSGSDSSPDQKQQQGDEQKDQQGQQGQDQQKQQQPSSSGKPEEQKQEKGSSGKEAKPEGDPGKESPEGEKKDASQGGEPKDDGESGDRQPLPAPAAEPKKEGDLRGVEPAEQTPEQREAEENAAEAQAAAEGRMTPRQARALLESMKSEDRKVRLPDPRESQGLKRVLKDW